MLIIMPKLEEKGIKYIECKNEEAIADCLRSFGISAHTAQLDKFYALRKCLEGDKRTLDDFLKVCNNELNQSLMDKIMFSIFDLIISINRVNKDSKLDIVLIDNGFLIKETSKSTGYQAFIYRVDGFDFEEALEVYSELSIIKASKFLN